MTVDKNDPRFRLGMEDTELASVDGEDAPRSDSGRPDRGRPGRDRGATTPSFSPMFDGGDDDEATIQADIGDLRQSANMASFLPDRNRPSDTVADHLAGASATDTLIDEGDDGYGAAQRPSFRPSPDSFPMPGDNGDNGDDDYDDRPDELSGNLSVGLSAGMSAGAPGRPPARAAHRLDSDPAGSTVEDDDDQPSHARPGGNPFARPDRASPTRPRPGAPADSPAMQTNTPSAARVYADGMATTISREQVDPARLKASQVIQIPYSSTDIIGTLGPYDILGELGRGAMGVVYKAYSLRLCRMCALKVMIAGQHASAVEIVRFQNEAMLAARLQHPNIVSVFDAGEIDGQFFFVMEYVEGHPLTALIAHGSNQALGAGLWAMVGVAEALQYAHDKGIIHRDIKPDNILIDAQGKPHITDFGIAKNVDAGASMTAAGAVIGTPAYMSPEQMNGEISAIGPRSDVYSLGATLYHLCAGQPPFVSESPIELMAQALLDEPPSPRDIAQKKLKRELALDLETICMQALEKDASNRYQSARALAEDLRAHLEDRPISARPISGAERLQKLLRRNRAAFVGATVVFFTLLIVGASFGVILAFNIERTSDSLRAQDVRAAIDQAGTLKSSIKVNMLQGRADVVRELVTRLRADRELSRIDVVRTDRTYAYTDLSTRKAVERRLNKPDVLAKIRVEWPRLVAAVEELRRVTFGNIDDNEKPSPGLYDYERSAWNDLLKAGQTVTRTEYIDGEPMLTVLAPLENGEECQACHGEVEDSAYAENKIRAVLVVQRSQRDVEARIQANKKSTYIVGASTAGAILLLTWIFARIFGVRLRRRRFAARR